MQGLDILIIGIERFEFKHPLYPPRDTP